MENNLNKKVSNCGKKNSIRSDKKGFLSTCFCVKILFSHVFLLYLSHSLGGR